MKHLIKIFLDKNQKNAYNKYGIYPIKEVHILEQFEIEFFETDSGDCPVTEFLNGTEIKMKAKILRMIELLEKNGNTLRMPYSEPLEDGIFELRAIMGNNIARVLYFFVIGRKIIMTNGFIKKTQKTPRQEIETAKKYRDIYLNRLKGE